MLASASSLCRAEFLELRVMSPLQILEFASSDFVLLAMTIGPSLREAVSVANRDEASPKVSSDNVFAK